MQWRLNRNFAIYSTVCTRCTHSCSNYFPWIYNSRIVHENQRTNKEVDDGDNVADSIWRNRLVDASQRNQTSQIIIVVIIAIWRGKMLLHMHMRWRRRCCGQRQGSKSRLLVPYDNIRNIYHTTNDIIFLLRFIPSLLPFSQFFF